VTRRLVRPLLALAVRRWPAHLRDEMRAEWEAELHELASQGRRARMLRFAASLATTRPQLGPRQPFLDTDTSAGAILRQAAFLVVAPAACVTLSTFSIFSIGFFALLPTMVIVLIAAAAGSSSPLVRPWSVVAAALTPAVATVLVSPSLEPYLDGGWRQPTATLLWALLLAAALAVASGRSPRTAALAGGAGALAACWSVVTLVIAPHASRLGLDSGYALLWYPASILYPIGIPLGALPPDPNNCLTGDQPCTQYLPPSFELLDFTEGYPTALTAIALYTAAYVLTATHRPALPLRDQGVPQVVRAT
jgi:hypothetical protein